MKNSIIDNSDHCYICKHYKNIERMGTEVHHCIHGIANRKIADKDGLYVKLCTQCHKLLHDKGLHDRDLQKAGEQAFIDYYKSSIPEFIKRYGKNYL